jgi:hypothetical protein
MYLVESWQQRLGTEIVETPQLRAALDVEMFDGVEASAFVRCGGSQWQAAECSDESSAMHP